MPNNQMLESSGKWVETPSFTTALQERLEVASMRCELKLARLMLEFRAATLTLKVGETPCWRDSLVKRRVLETIALVETPQPQPPQAKTLR